MTTTEQKPEAGEVLAFKGGSESVLCLVPRHRYEALNGPVAAKAEDLEQLGFVPAASLAAAEAKRRSAELGLELFQQSAAVVEKRNAALTEQLAAAEAELRDLKAALRRTTQSVAEPAEMPDSPEEQLKMLDLECTCEWERAEAAEVRVAELRTLAARLGRWCRNNYLFDKGIPDELHELEECILGESQGDRGEAAKSASLRRAEAAEVRVAELAAMHSDLMRDNNELSSKVMEQATKLASERAGREREVADYRLLLDVKLRADMLYCALALGERFGWNRYIEALYEELGKALEAAKLPPAPASPSEDPKMPVVWPSDPTCPKCGGRGRVPSYDPEAQPRAPSEGPASPVAEGEAMDSRGDARLLLKERNHYRNRAAAFEEQLRAQAAEREALLCVEMLANRLTGYRLSYPSTDAHDAGRALEKQLERVAALRSQQTPTCTCAGDSFEKLMAGGGHGSDCSLRNRPTPTGEAGPAKPLNQRALDQIALRASDDASPVAPAAEGEHVITYPNWCNCGRGKGTPHVEGCAALTDAEPPPASPPARIQLREPTQSKMPPGGVPLLDQQPASDAGGEKPAVCPTCSKDRQVPPYWCFDEWHPQNKPQPPPTEALMKALRDAENELSEMLRQHGVLTSANMDPSHRFFVALFDVVKKLADGLTKGAKTK